MAHKTIALTTELRELRIAVIPDTSRPDKLLLQDPQKKSTSTFLPRPLTFRTTICTNLRRWLSRLGSAYKRDLSLHGCCRIFCNTICRIALLLSQTWVWRLRAMQDLGARWNLSLRTKFVSRETRIFKFVSSETRIFKFVSEETSVPREHVQTPPETAWFHNISLFRRLNLWPPALILWPSGLDLRLNFYQMQYLSRTEKSRLIANIVLMLYLYFHICMVTKIYVMSLYISLYQIERQTTPINEQITIIERTLQ